MTTAIAVITLPIQLVTTAVGGCLTVITFGLFLILLNIVWLVLLGPIIGLSWAWLEAEKLRHPLLVNSIRLPVAVAGLLMAIAGEIWVALSPSMGELNARGQKLILCWVWPYSWDYMRYTNNHDRFANGVSGRRMAELVRAIQIIRIQP